MSNPLISIGMPVYNGGEFLPRALDALLAQTHTNFELIISDNASTDEATRRVTEEYACSDSRIRLTRQPVNIGAVANFIWVTQQARGAYFMWAAHDDCWSPIYLEVLARKLDECPAAVLATPLCQVETTLRDGSTQQERIPAAPNQNPDKTLQVYTEHFKACLWLYGLYRTNWIQQTAPEWKQYPMLSGDVIWLWGVLLTNRVVGDEAAIFYYTSDHRARRRLTYRQTMQMWGIDACHMTRLSWQRLPPGQRVAGVLKAWKYVYLHHLRRKNIVQTAIRIAKISLLWCWIGLETGIRQVLGMGAQTIRCRALTEPSKETVPMNTSRDNEVKQESLNAA
ncbi:MULTISPECIES: glycosyltransferase family 2 protein [unclassified Schlesneria]|uniref:glycosyltransferase family 2 protein n=1 Tax=unclassified Schlesneria TaxID=2762017 RepID=UPI002F1DDB47